MIKNDFVHLKLHSEYSLKDGLGKLESIISKAVAFNMKSLAITDFTNLFGLIKFYRTAKNMGIKPIIGADFLIKNEKFLKNQYFEITILAHNNTGYKNLVALISEAYTFKYDINLPCINYYILKKYNKGLILISGGTEGDVGKYLIQDNFELLESTIKFYKSYFYDRYYLSLTRIQKKEEDLYINLAVEFAVSNDIPVVATNDVKFIEPKDFEIHKIKVAIQQNLNIKNIETSNMYTSQQYMKNIPEMYDLFADLPESLINSTEIAKRCNVDITFKKNCLPKFQNKNISSMNELYEKSIQGLQVRLNEQFPVIKIREKKEILYFNRLKNELEIIKRTNFPDYFLIVMEFIKWAKENKIPVGPGRGSGAGSLVAYALRITDIDPISFDLIFERFLNPERISMPDLDIDFCMDKRDLVINHIIEKYKNNMVSQIITFGTMTPRSVIKDVGRVLGYQYNFINKIAKLIPYEIGMTVKKAFNIKIQLKEIFSSNEDIKNLVSIASKLEGTIRNISKHAGGLIIAPNWSKKLIPIFRDKEDKFPVTQFDKDDIEKIGLIKFDFLGLKTLTVINNTIDIINKKLKNNKIDIIKISLHDKMSFNLLNNLKTNAIFQLESLGMKHLIKLLKPDCFEDIISLIALFRPGPLQSGMVKNFIDRKHGIEKIYYPDKKWNHKLLKPILKSTYGIILYQEQVMKIAQVLAGYSLEKADILRLAMSKKDIQEMQKQRLIFARGAKNLGVQDKLSMKIFDIMEKFAGYGFNKSHSTAYALIAYQTLWLKTHYPAEFFTATINSDINNQKKIVNLIEECHSINILVIPPNINYSKYYFYVNDNKEIICGLGMIKGIGLSIVQELLESRKKYGKFKDIFDICQRLNKKKLNKRILKNLIFSGAMDCLGVHRSYLKQNLVNAIQMSAQINKDHISGQFDLLDNLLKKSHRLSFIKNENIQEYPASILLKGEYETLGYPITKHPIIGFFNQMEDSNITMIKNINEYQNKKNIYIIGIIISIKNIQEKTKNFHIIKLNDYSGKLKIFISNAKIIKYRNFLKLYTLLLIYGQVFFDDYNNNYVIYANKVIKIVEKNEKSIQDSIIIKLYEKKFSFQAITKLLLYLNKYKIGNFQIVLRIETEKYKEIYLKSSWKINKDKKTIENIRKDIKKIKIFYNLKFQETFYAI